MTGLKGLCSQAERLARKRGQTQTTGHLLLALYQRTGAGALLGELGVLEASLIAALVRETEEPPNLLPLVLERAERAATASGQTRASGLHLLLVFAREPRSAAHRVLQRAGVSASAVQAAIAERLQTPVSAPPRAASLRTSHGGRARNPAQLSAQHRLAAETEQRRRQRTSAMPDRPVAREAEPVREPAKHVSPPRAKAATVPAPEAQPFALDPKLFPLLSSLGRNLCSAALEGRIDPVLGRDAEIEQVLDVLSRRRANNPLLVGPPGVGKTAIVEGVALALVQGRARGLSDRVVVELPAAALLAGTGVRGALSERLSALTQEIAQARGRVAVFIDEIHGVVGSDDGADSLTGGLKTALARGELPCIGATTDAEHRRIFERDAALARRFTRIDVSEPSPDAALAILRGVVPEYEKHHGIAFAPEALGAAVDLSVRFLTERRLPDKAIGLLDQAAARVRRRGGTVVDLRALAEVVSEHTGVTVDRLLMRDAEALLALEAVLEQRIVGQPRAVAAVADALRKGAAGFRGPRPLGTFLLLGPTGVGKTELAKAVSELLFPGQPLTRLDMSELSEPHAVARMLGAPPGYLGHDEGGQLTEPVRARPYQLVLLDEIEKAHREVLLALLPLLDEGRISDARGRVVDFRNTVVMMTSNLGAVIEPSRARMGFGAEEPRADSSAHAALALAAARKALPPELWNRIDEPLCFEPLDRASLLRIAERMVADAASVMAKTHGIEVRAERSAFEALLNAGGYDPALGARPMRRTISRLIEARLAKAVLAGEITGGDHVVIRGSGDQITLERAAGPVAAAAE